MWVRVYRYVPCTMTAEPTFFNLYNFSKKSVFLSYPAYHGRKTNFLRILTRFSLGVGSG